MLCAVATYASLSARHLAEGARPLAGTPAPPAGQPAASPAPSTDAPAGVRTGPSFPDLLLTNQQGEPVHFYADLVRGKTVLINFMFTSCESLCPRTTANLQRVQELLGDRLGKDIFFISITVDPAHDTPKVLKEYAAEFKVRPGWQFITGTTAQIDELRRKLGAYEKDQWLDDDKTQHTGMIIYGNEPKRRWGKVYAMAEPASIVANVTRWAPAH